MSSSYDFSKRNKFSPSQNKKKKEIGSQQESFVDNRASSNEISQLQSNVNSSINSQEITQLQEKVDNTTGMPDDLKKGVENLSGHDMSDVKVHYNSDKPAQLQAHAYAQGTDIHIAPGQEKHLPHEAWHVVQQKQGRVEPTKQMKSKVNINDDPGLEKEADIMGAKALEMGSERSDNKKLTSQLKSSSNSILQKTSNEKDNKKQSESGQRAASFAVDFYGYDDDSEENDLKANKKFDKEANAEVEKVKTTMTPVKEKLSQISTLGDDAVSSMSNNPEQAAIENPSKLMSFINFLGSVKDSILDKFKWLANWVHTIGEPKLRVPEKYKVLRFVEMAGYKALKFLIVGLKASSSFLPMVANVTKFVTDASNTIKRATDWTKFKEAYEGVQAHWISGVKLMTAFKFGAVKSFRAVMTNISITLTDIGATVGEIIGLAVPPPGAATAISTLIQKIVTYSIKLAENGRGFWKYMTKTLHKDRKEQTRVLLEAALHENEEGDFALKFLQKIDSTVDRAKIRAVLKPQEHTLWWVQSPFSDRIIAAGVKASPGLDATAVYKAMSSKSGMQHNKGLFDAVVFAAGGVAGEVFSSIAAGSEVQSESLQ